MKAPSGREEHEVARNDAQNATLVAGTGGVGGISVGGSRATGGWVGTIAPTLLSTSSTSPTDGVLSTLRSRVASSLG